MLFTIHRCIIALITIFEENNYYIRISIQTLISQLLFEHNYQLISPLSNVSVTCGILCELMEVSLRVITVILAKNYF